MRMMHGTPSAERGFTLIELMIVVAIIGILAAVAVPAYQDYVGTAKLTEAAPIMRPYKEMVQEFHAHRGYLPRDNAELGIPSPEQIRGSHVASVHIENGAIRTRFTAAAAAEIGLNEVVTRPCIVPDTPTSPLVWGCESANDQASSPYRTAGPRTAESGDRQ